MSINQLSRLAVARDRGTPTKSRPKGEDDDGLLHPTGPDTPATWADTLLAAIPTEPLALYTGVATGIIAIITSDEPRHAYSPLRWWVFAIGCVVVLVWVVRGYRAEYKPNGDSPPADGAIGPRKLPTAELITAVVAFAAWALCMPESPMRSQIDGALQGIVTLIVSGGAFIFLSVFAWVSLTQQASRRE